VFKEKSLEVERGFVTGRRKKVKRDQSAERKEERSSKTPTS